MADCYEKPFLSWIRLQAGRRVAAGIVVRGGSVMVFAVIEANIISAQEAAGPVGLVPTAAAGIN